MDELNARIEALRAEIEELRAAERTVENAQRIVAARSELAAATSEVETLTAAEAALSELDAEAEAAAVATAEAAAAAAAGDGGEGEGEGGEGGEGEGEGGEAPAAERVLVTASAEGDVSPTATPAEPLLTLTASANVGGVAAGTQLSQSDVQRMLNGALRAGAAVTPQTRIFEVNTHRPDQEVVSSNRSAFENSMLMRAAAEQNSQSLALTAGACWCAPDRVENDVQVVGDLGRPVAGLFPSVPVDGTFRYIAPLCLTDTNSVNKWTCVDQDAVDPDDPLTWKQCSELDCFTENTVEPYFVTACTVVGRAHQFQHPNQVEAWLDAIRIEYDRKAEVRLLDKIEADAGAPLTVGLGTMSDHGLLSKLLYVLGSVSHALGYEYRSSGLEGRTLIVSRGLIDALLADEHLRGFNHNKTRAELLSKLRNDYGINLIERLDESSARQAVSDASVAALNAGGAIDAAPVVIAPPSWRVYVVDPSQYRRGEGTLVGADWHVDTNLLRQNKLMWFLENMEFLELMGCKKPHTVDITGCINGARSDLVAPPACA